MIFAILRLALIGIVVIGLSYLLLSIYFRSLARENLEKEWEAEGRPGPRDAYVEAGMKEYDASLRPKLLLAVLILPVIAVGTLIYVMNFI